MQPLLFFASKPYNNSLLAGKHIQNRKQQKNLILVAILIVAKHADRHITSILFCYLKVATRN